MVREKKSGIVFLLETKLKTNRMEAVKRRMGFDGCFVVEAEGRKAGLALLWKYKNEVEILNFSRWHINAWISEDDGKSKWLLTAFYGHPNIRKKKES